ncbi:hypothetical protein BJ138DRAFT_1126399 [Hygrophoropsis aurantiaca]|uniref:Uncharacterized protein n=1 Tax=Hygrophoropsis aurantiaca TaxID=72124 RepID=A0ACB8AE33_9AGAM|nr:hypothetical protein BJ138DRAFT_1126399 [Hygrophoropsis aurantiaca]
MTMPLPPPPSEMEASIYYSGLPSTPKLVARTSTTPWHAPGLELYRQFKQLRPAGNHALQDTWEDNLAFKVHALLDSMKVEWTSTDVVRIVNAGAASSSAPVTIWIGVLPESLSGNDGVVVVSKCQALLVENGITDVEVEIRESVVTRSAGPKLFNTSNLYTDPTVAGVREPLTTTLGLPISAQSTPWAEGTAGFFMVEDGVPERLLLVTARHVVFPPHKNEMNEHFEHKNDSQHRHNVTLFGDSGFPKYLECIKSKIEEKEFDAKLREEGMRAAGTRDDLEANAVRKKAQAELDDAREAMKWLSTFHGDVVTRWATPESRVLGHVILSPPTKPSAGSSSEAHFNGNVMDLGTTDISEYKLNCMMHPNIQNVESFKYPHNGLLMLRGTIPVDEMRHPTACDQDKQPSLMVVKRGTATGLTIGHANNICSYTRCYKGYDDDDIKEATSKEWSILPCDKSSGPFSANGDSGSVVVDGCGRIGGLFTGGAAAALSSKMDITYATPISFILKRMQHHGIIQPNINPVLAI